MAIGGATPRPIDLPGVIVAGLVTIASGMVLGPEAPLIALGSGVAVLTLRLARGDGAPQVLPVVAAAGGFAALSFIFDSPLIAAVILIEATAIGGGRQALILGPDPTALEADVEPRLDARHVRHRGAAQLSRCVLHREHGQAERQSIPTVATVLVVVAVVAIEFVLIEIPLLGYATRPVSTAGLVERGSDWLAQRGGRLALIGATAIGVWLLVRGFLNL